ncbi:DUF2461 domain-containing protein [Blastococcus sp. CT_GayMR16]|uniref:DUF2461 domain-containing protein n=1 Tax=Blastococcus sp. CT_GayMR16 TaxID=2559607 RepID=UPI001073473F|nr:DUF2461 domain-containing protein [Blastococcus sp. CT_GayMR16]TFV86870.1 DUF2461 domain-containing protein [Blastococcus sp. CT_GayMR16]
MTFEGFPDDGLVFYEGLEADNSKTYWTQHKGAYDRNVKAPLVALLDELAPEFGTAKIFRPYRDVRFSNDKTPYKTHQGAVVHADGHGTGAWYVQISADGLHVSGGSWRLESDQVARYRRAVADDVQGLRLQAEVDRLAAAGWEIRGEKLTRVPAGYSADAERLDLLRHKSLHASRSWEPAEWLHEPRALDEVRSAWRELRTLNTWLADNVGATTKEPRARR